MKSINHHPSDELLLEYSAGNVSGGNAVCIAAHLEACPKCQAAHKRNNAIGGALMNDLSTHKVNEKLKQSVLKEITEGAKQSSVVSDMRTTAPADNEIDNKEPSKETDISSRIPRSIRKFVPKSFADLPWSFATASAKSCLLFKDEAGSAVSLLRIKPGGKISHHKHMGDEYTLILSGSFSDEDGIYKAGDFMLRNNKHQHSPVATKDMECICLTVQEAPLQFTGRLWKILNPFIRKSFQPS